MVAITKWLGSSPGELRDDFQESGDHHLRLRRAQVATNLIGIGMMALTALLQIGAIRHLPEPSVGNFRTRKVNLSDEAFSYGGPDSPVNIVAHAVNLMLASTGSITRARRNPWIPLMATAIAAAQAGVAAKYLFYQMPKVDEAWCPYCIVDALAHFTHFGLTLPEALEAIEAVRHAAQR